MKKHLLFLMSLLMASPAAFTAKAEEVLFEGFEGWDGTPDWLPQGWERISKTPNAVLRDKWTPLRPDDKVGVELDAMVEGQVYMEPNVSTYYKDEWLVTPEVKLPEESELSFYMWQNYLFWCVLYDEEHWMPGDTEFRLQECSATLQIWILPEDGEWEMLKDFYKDEVEGKSFYQLLLDQRFCGFKKKTVTLRDYAGQRVKIGFRYVGTDGDNVCLDAISIATRTVGADYNVPLTALYWGTKCAPGVQLPEESVEFYPAFTDLTWARMSNQTGATYSWSYQDGRAPLKNSDERYLKINFVPDFSSDLTAITSIYNTPVLTGVMDDYEDGVYTGFGSLLQVGGVPRDKNGDTYGVLPFDPVHEGMSILDTYFAGEMIPVGGHCPLSDAYWSYYWSGADSADDPDNHAEMVGVANLLPAPPSPLVVSGGWLNAKGDIADMSKVNVTMTIYPTDMDGNIDLQNPLASGSCSGSDLLINGCDITFPFSLNREVMMSVDNSDMYYIEITGLHSDAFSYIAPYISNTPHKMGANHGWVRYDAKKGGEERIEMGPLKYFYRRGEECNNAFAINLEGEYPYLFIEKKYLHPGRGKEVEIPFISYYDSSELTVSVAGDKCNSVKARLDGRFNKSRLIIEDNCACESIHEFTITISSRAQSVKTFISEDPSGVSILSGERAELQSVWHLDGSEADANELEPGVYVGRYSDGTTKKIIIK